jgi:hypothetical protein
MAACAFALDEVTTMRRFRTALLMSALLLVLLVPSAEAGKPATRGILPPSAHPHGHSLTELATAWNVWAFGSAADVNPLLAVRCEQSTIDPKVWFLPVSLGGEYQTTCDVPQGSFLLLNPGGSECSNVEAEPFFGADEADLGACVDETFPLLTYVELTFNGTITTDLDDYIVTTPLTNLPANNLFSTSPALSRDKGYFLVVAPLSRGTHTLHTYDEFESFDFQAGITYTINVH